MTDASGGFDVAGKQADQTVQYSAGFAGDAEYASSESRIATVTMYTIFG